MGKAEISGVAIGLCHEAPLRLSAGIEACQMRAGDWVVPLVPNRLFVIICNKAVL